MKVSLVSLKNAAASFWDSPPKLELKPIRDHEEGEDQFAAEALIVQLEEEDYISVPALRTGS